MNIIFLSISPSTRENYIAEKLTACRQNPSSEQLEEINQNVGKTVLPLTAEADLPAFTEAQSRLIETNKKEFLDNLSAIVPLLPDETVENIGFSLLNTDSHGFAANTPVLTISSNFSTLQYLLCGHRIEDGVLKEATPDFQKPDKPISVKPTVVSDDNISIGEYIEDLAEALIEGGISAVLGEIGGMVVGAFFSCLEVKELEEYVKQQIEENDIKNCTTDLKTTIEWIGNSYHREKDDWESLNDQLTSITRTLNRLARYHAAFPVYAVAANFALLFCKQMDSLPASAKNGLQTPIYAPQFVNILTQLIRGSFEKRASWVEIIGASNYTGNYVYYNDYFNGNSGKELKLPACTGAAYNQVCLQAEYGKVNYIWNTLLPDFEKTYQTSIAAINTWCELTKQTPPRFSYGDRLMGMTNEYIPAGGGIISAEGKYCLLYYSGSQSNLFSDYQLVIFSTADGKPIWQTGCNRNAWRTYMQQDCNFVVYSGQPEGWQGAESTNAVIWDPYPCPISNVDDMYVSPDKTAVFNTVTDKGAGPLDYYIIMQDDGNLVIYPTVDPSPSNAVWSSWGHPQS